MKQTVAELGIGGEGWIIYDGDGILPKHVLHVCVVDNLNKDHEYLMPKYVLRVYIESNGVNTTKDIVLFGNEIVYGSKEEAETELQERANNTTTSIESENVDWQKLADEVVHIQKRLSEITEDQKKDFYTFIKKLKNIADPQPDNIDWKQVRINASISALNALLGTTKQSVLEELAIKDIITKTALEYTDKLVYELKRSEALFEEKLKEI